MPGHPRRSPAPDERRRDAERTRRALLDAARAEFAAKGLAGARVSAIAERAGVNKQLISYYFGGKQGLYQALMDQWLAQEATLDEPGIDLAELVLRYLKIGHEQPDLQRIFIREMLDENTSEVEHEPDSADLQALRARQAAGEFAADFDPGFVLLAMQAIVVAGVVFPRDVKRYLGLDPSSPEYLDHVGAQLRLLVEHLK
jgi:AcrR family transcriptional regulator